MEPADHTLRVLKEIRDDLHGFRTEQKAFNEDQKAFNAEMLALQKHQPAFDARVWMRFQAIDAALDEVSRQIATIRRLVGTAST